ncbi:MAG: AAA family ATPase [Chloroflexi bacterium]|nr:AAA family ATPase [Chloroflexota bacterium]
MYKSFRVKNFRCFKDLQINDLGRVNLIAGKNNTGKTALLEAMHLLGRPLFPPLLFELQELRGVEVPNNHHVPVWRLFFYNVTSDNDIQVSARHMDSNEPVSLSIKEYANSQENAEAFVKHFQHLTALGVPAAQANGYITRAIAMLEFIHIDELGTARDAHYLPNSPVPINTVADDKSIFLPVGWRPDRQLVASQFSLADLGGKLEHLERICRLFEPKITDMRLLSPLGEPTIWARLNGIQLPLNLMGDGMNHVCGFILAMLLNPRYLLIDEIENGIHFSLQSEVWKAIGQVARELDIQVFATTHSLEMIRAAYEAFSEDGKLDEFRYHRLYRSRKTGEIKAATYNELDMEAVAAFDFDHEVR